MNIYLDPSDDKSSSLFYLLKKYTEHNIIFDKEKKSEFEIIMKAFEKTVVFPFIFIIRENLNKKKETDKISTKAVEDISVLQNIYYSFIYTDKKFLNKLKKELKLKNLSEDTSTFRDLYLNDAISAQLKEMMRKKETCRFPPEPSGYLHIGHVKAALLNNDLADNLIIRFDDTNQEKGSESYEESIIEDLKLLELKEFHLSRTSDFYQKIIECAKKLILENKAYCDNTDRETMNQERMDGIESKNRNNSIDKNKSIFDKMIKNGEKDVEECKNSEIEEYCVRAKISIDEKNKSLRDPVILRLKNSKHPKTKSRLSPTYDFACPLVDSLQQITTVLRTNEFRDRNPQYFWILDALKMKKPKIKDFSRLNFEDTCLSKRKLRAVIEEHDLTWQDPRIPTIKGILRLGLHIDVLKEYIRLQGMKQGNCIASWDKIWAMNKKYLDKTCNRYSAILSDNYYKIDFIDNKGARINPYDPIISLPLNKKNQNSKQKEVLTTSIAISNEDANILKINEEFTLMALGNAILKKKTENKLICESNPTGNYKLTKNKISWISLDSAIEYNLTTYGSLFKDGKFNHDSKLTEKILIEKAAESIKYNEMVQFERIAFVKKDETSHEFVVVPYTRQVHKK